MTTKYCRWCGQGFRNVNWGDFFVDAGRAHYITASAELMTGDRKPEPVRKEKLKTIDLDDFLETDPEVLLEVSPEPAVQEKPDGLV